MSNFARAAIWRGVCSCASKSVCRMSLTTNCKSEKGCKIPVNLCTSVNQTAVIECLQETKVKIIFTNNYYFIIIL